MTVYLTVGDVLTLHEQEVGANLLADFGLLDRPSCGPRPASVARTPTPTSTPRRPPSSIPSPAFIDGKKRIAVAATALFYLLNGHDLDAEAHDLVALAVDTAGGLRTVADIAGQLKHWAVPLPFGPE